MQDGEAPIPAFASCDGEAIILDTILSKDILDKLNRSAIMIGKVSASCSGIHQASDVSPVFRALKCLHDRGVKVSNPVLFNLVISAITEFEKENSIQVGSEYKGKIATKGCVVITRSCNAGWTDFFSCA